MGNGVVFAQSEAETRDRIECTWKLVSTEQALTDGTTRPYMDPMERASNPPHSRASVHLLLRGRPKRQGTSRLPPERPHAFLSCNGRPKAPCAPTGNSDRKSTRLNSSHLGISY